MGDHKQKIVSRVTPLASDPPAELKPRMEVQQEQWIRRRVKDFEGTVDHLRVLLKQERSHNYTPCMDYLSDINSDKNAENEQEQQQGFGGEHVDTVNETWRRKLCEWSFQVADHFNMEREVVSIAMNYLDRIVAKSLESSDRPIAKREFQLVAVSSLYVAVKLHGEHADLEAESDNRRLDIGVFVDLSRGFFQVETLEAMELSILFNLGWHLNPPTPLKFISSLIRLIPSWTPAEYQPSFRQVSKAIFDISMYLTELSVCVSTFTFHSKNSVVAYAAILSAIDSLEEVLPLPYDIRVQFLNNVAEATGLLPEMEQVRSARNLLMQICPFIQERDVAALIMDDEGGKSSPVCVSHVVSEQEEEEESRKRGRS